MTIYSHSRLSTFEQCRLKFKFRYLDKITVLERTIEAFLGKVVHNTLEWFYLEVKQGKIPSIDEMITYYVKDWEKDYDNSIRIVRQENSVKDYFNKGVQFLLNYYSKHKPFEDNTLEVEKRIVIDLDGTGQYKIQGFIDRLVHNLKENRLEIHDYKTANNLPTREKVENDRQLALYSIAVREMFGQDKEVHLIWHYLAHNQKIVSTRTSEQLQELKENTINLIKEIEAATEFPPNKSILCEWCEYKSRCPIFAAQKKIEEFVEDKVDESCNLNEKKKLDIW